MGGAEISSGAAEEDPQETMLRFLEQVHGIQIADEPRPGTPLAKLQALVEAHEQGLITESECDAAVRRLMLRR